MSQLEYLLIGGLIALVSAVTVQLVSHRLSLKRDEIHRAEDLKKDLKKEIKELEKEKKDLEREEVRLNAEVREYATGKIIFQMNQRRDIVSGFNQDEMGRRAIAMRTILSEYDLNELKAIADEKEPLPVIPGKPRADDL